MKKIFIISSLILSVFFSAKETEKKNFSLKKNHISLNEKKLLLETFKGRIKSMNENGFTWNDSCGGSHYFHFFKFFSIYEILEEIWSMDGEYCP
jgi:hypothetical protein